MVLAAIKKVFQKIKPTPDPDEITPEDEQLYRYWVGFQVRLAMKAQPTKEWEEADGRLKCKTAKGETKIPYVNDYRNMYEKLKSFLDQTTANFQCLPTEAFQNDENVIKQAECDQRALLYWWDEQKCQQMQSMKLDSCLRRNIGTTMPYFDRKKWMPAIQYIPARKVLVDPDCEGDESKAGWMGYYESTSIEELKAMHPELSDKAIEEILSVAGSTLTQEELENKDIKDSDKEMHASVTIYHIFTRNDAAIRVIKEDEPEPPSEEEAARLESSTPRRYLLFARGHKKPLLDWDYWPYDLDDNEFPPTNLSFNRLVEDAFGYTDFQQMKRLDILDDAINADIEQSSFWAGNKKFAGTAEAGSLSEAEMDAFLKDPTRRYLPNMIGSDGKSKVQEIDTGEFSPELIQAAKYVSERKKEASALGELLSQEARQYKDVAATSAMIHDANTHQFTNRRLGGPQGYEESMARDAIKMLEIAHQYVPRYSTVLIPIDEFSLNEENQSYATGNTLKHEMKNVPWEQAQKYLLRPGVELKALGIDAIVGPELAPYWRTADEYPPRVFKLATRVRVVPGSTRQITKDQKAAVYKQYYTDVLEPLFESMGRADLKVKFAKLILDQLNIHRSDDYLPTKDEIQTFQKFDNAMKALAVKQSMAAQGQEQAV